MSEPTIKAIARAAGVSTATVSKALNDMPDISASTKERIRRIAQEMGYTININARQLAKGHSYSVGVILPDIAYRPIAEFYKSVADRLARAGYSVYLSNSMENTRTEVECAELMTQMRVGALIIMPSTTEMRHIESTVRNTIPIIYVGGAINSLATCTVACDEFSGGQMAARHLHHRGHTICEVYTYGPAATARHERMRGFVDYMQRHGCNVRMRSASPSATGEDAGRELMQIAARQGMLPTAIFATDDMIAIGAMSALHEMGLRVPEDVSIIGYDDLPCSSLSLVQLTTIRTPHGELGICAGDLAAALMEGNTNIVKKLTLEPQIVRRSTVAQLVKS